VVEVESQGPSAQLSSFGNGERGVRKSTSRERKGTGLQEPGLGEGLRLCVGDDEMVEDAHVEE
jgi:hypothetical protein